MGDKDSMALNFLPLGEWTCPYCEEHGPPEKQIAVPEPELGRGNNDYCKACQAPGILLCCDTCPNSYHAYCLYPPLTEPPDEEEEWSCPQCQVPETDRKPERIITWRWKEFDYPDPVAEEDLLKEDETQGIFRSCVLFQHLF